MDLFINKIASSILQIILFAIIPFIWWIVKYSLQGTTQGNGLTGGLPPVRFSM